MAVYPSVKEISKVKKGKKFSKFDILSAMAVMDNVQNYYKNSQGKQEIKSSNNERKKDKEKKAFQNER
jgi:hypothetical protein